MSALLCNWVFPPLSRRNRRQSEPVASKTCLLTRNWPLWRFSAPVARFVAFGFWASAGRGLREPWCGLDRDASAGALVKEFAANTGGAINLFRCGFAHGNWRKQPGENQIVTFKPIHGSGIGFATGLPFVHPRCFTMLAALRSCRILRFAFLCIKPCRYPAAEACASN